MFEENLSEMAQRCVDYINKVADKEGFVVSLKPTHSNEEAMIALWDLIHSEQADNHELLKAMSYQVAQLSRVAEMQGLLFEEPSKEDKELYERLFNSPIRLLNTCDSEYVEPRGETVYIEYDIESDDEGALKLTPNVQLTLFDLFGTAEENHYAESSERNAAL